MKMKHLKNKDGFSYIVTCVIILFAVLLIFALMQYMYIFHTAKQQKNYVRLALDGYVTRYAVTSFDALKQGGNYGVYLDRTGLTEGAYPLLGFSHVTTLEIREVNKEQLVYIMSRPEIYGVTNGSFGLNVKYTLTIPFELFGRKVADIKIPVEIISRYTEKYGG